MYVFLRLIYRYSYVGWIFNKLIIKIEFKICHLMSAMDIPIFISCQSFVNRLFFIDE